MKLIKLKIENFRSYKEEVSIDFDDLTAFIGKNDAGKSTVLEALEIFFNNNLVTCEKEDLNVNSKDDEIKITCLFDELPQDITIDKTSITTLKDECLLNKDGLLEIKKVFKATAAKPKEKVYIVCNHPTNKYVNELLMLKQTDLKKRAKELEIDKDSYSANNNVSIRKAIRQACAPLQFEEVEVLADSEDAKKIFDTLKSYLPTYALFQSDRASTEDDKEVADPMKFAVRQALEELTTEIEEIKKEVMQKAMETANRTLEKLNEMDKELASSLKPEFKSEPKFDSQFKLSIHSDDGISINKRGSGARRLILLNFFRAEVERKMKDKDSKNVIYAFEEPETSQHPKHQKMIIESFLELAYNTNSQVILTTHTPALAGLLPLESLRFVTIQDDKKVIKSGSSTVYKEIADTLGLVSENISLMTKALLLVEGQGDVVFVRHLCTMLKAGGYIDRTLEEAGFMLIPTGGCGNLNAWVTYNLAEQFNVPWCVLQDSDLGTQEGEKNIKRMAPLKSKGIKAYLTKKREPENYLHQDCFEFPVEITDDNDVKLAVNLANPKIRRSSVLEIFWPKMTCDNIRETEYYSDEDGNDCYEFTDMISDFLTLVD
ncbi:ATP-binding protein [Vagococcus coleopterorum]|uniref:ATP-binding protein n=1 Tax=Vagococcus coleopterorum TaxID=2714946 RepID=A0A6G8AL03_9ENTE|nr:ATP-binding protein [Vagococcus coleopterorum]QIL45667.1 ATP-binding protein [Vagococcus coleopterorum]